MADPDRDLLLGRLAVHFKLLDKERLVAALKHFRSTGSTLDFGTFLVAEDYIEPGVLGKLLKARDEYERRQREQGASPPAKSAPSVPSPRMVTPPASPPEARLGSADTGDAMPAMPAMPALDDTRPVIEPVERPDAPARDEADSPTALPGETAAIPAVAEVSPMATDEPLTLVRDESSSDSLELERGSGLLAYEPGATLEALLQETVRLGASDLHIHSGAPLKVRRDGRLQDASTTVMTNDEATRLITSVLDADQQTRLDEKLQVDFAYAIPEVGRFRVNAYQQQRGLDAVYRAIPATPPSLDDLGLPAILEQMTHHQQGLVLLTGPAGCGKSSTMAAMIELINQERTDHVLTVEDPIEQVFTSKKCLVNQRQVGQHTQSFARALRAALREDPDVIVIGELRDLETISLALTAAETGHLVLGTLHTSSALRTINRLLGVFPSNQQDQVRTMVSESLRSIVSQRLVPKADGTGRVAACEILINNHAIGNLIRENKTHQIRSVMQTSAGTGMCLLDVALADLVRSGTISSEDAREQADEPEKMP